MVKITSYQAHKAIKVKSTRKREKYRWQLIGNLKALGETRMNLIERTFNGSCTQSHTE